MTTSRLAAQHKTFTGYGHRTLVDTGTLEVPFYGFSVGLFGATITELDPVDGYIIDENFKDFPFVPGQYYFGYFNKITIIEGAVDVLLDKR